MDSGFIKEVRFPKWLAKVVVVRKSSVKWRMCGDYIALNKACPKDPYPFLNLNRTVYGCLFKVYPNKNASSGHREDDFCYRSGYLLL